MNIISNIYVRAVRVVLVGFFITAIFFTASCDKDVETDENYVILVSFDGTRWDYPDLYDMPNFDELAEKGVKAERVISSFPTKTFPNHYSIATGLYPDHHGLINNTFYAPDLKLLYRIGDRSMVMNPDFYGGEPIWNTAEKQGLMTGSFFWVGSEAPIQGMQPTYWKKYDGSVPFRSRVDSVIAWLNKPIEERPRLVLLYFQQPDGVGHEYGPVHEETGKVVEEMDKVLGYLEKKISRLPFSERVNLIVTSDHGMGSISEERYINLLDYVNESWIEQIAGGNPVFLADVAEGYDDSVKKVLEPVEGVSALLKDEIPSHYHYGTNSRIPEMMLLADSSWSIGLDPLPGDYMKGAHGYDPANTDMHHIFFATGPAFKEGYVHPPFENVNIYPLIAHILQIEPAQTDGRLENVKSMLKE